MWCEELTHWKRPWCWERLKVGGEGDNRGWDGWMASPTQWIRVWVNARSWWWTGRPAVLRSVGSQRVGRDWTDWSYQEGGGWLHPSADTGLKLHWHSPATRADTVFPSPSHLELYTNPSIRGQTEEARRTAILQWLEQKSHYRKLIRMKKQKVMSLMKGQDKTPEKQPNKVEIGNLPEKEFRIIIVKMIRDLRKTMEKMQKMFTKNLQEWTNKQMNNTLEGINSRITEAEERINDLDEKMV